MDFIDTKLVAYALQNSSKQSDFLEHIESETYTSIQDPHMLSWNLQWRFLSFISHCINPQNILEIWTYVWFSTFCLLEWLQTDGHIDTLEKNDTYANIAQSYFNQTPQWSLITIHRWDANNTLELLDRQYDLIFIDADKPNYLNYYKKAITMLRPWGLILIDNTLRYGKILDKHLIQYDLDTKCIAECNEYIAKDDTVMKLLLPFRDWVTLVRKN